MKACGCCARHSNHDDESSKRSQWPGEKEEEKEPERLVVNSLGGAGAGDGGGVGEEVLEWNLATSRDGGWIHESSAGGDCDDEEFWLEFPPPPATCSDDQLASRLPLWRAKVRPTMAGCDGDDDDFPE